MRLQTSGCTKLGGFLRSNYYLGYDGSFSKTYQKRMAKTLVSAIDARKALCLGSLWQPGRSDAPYSTVFVAGDSNDDDSDDECIPKLVFTSLSAQASGLEDLDPMNSTGMWS
jgi:hypothetical protein